MDLDAFLIFERQRLDEERQRLSVLSAREQKEPEKKSTYDLNEEEKCPALQYINNKSYTAVKCKYQCSEDTEDPEVKVEESFFEDPLNTKNTIKHASFNAMSSNTTNLPDLSSLATTDTTSRQQQFTPNEDTTTSTTSNITGGSASTKTFCFFTQHAPEYETENAAAIIRLNNMISSDSKRTENAGNAHYKEPMKLSKQAKEWVNQKELSAATSNLMKNNGRKYSEEEKQQQKSIRRRRGKEDDMEQWVSDTFFSYFPGFNNENQKRQQYLRERQRENQENFLKHQMSHPVVKKHAAKLNSNNNKSKERNVQTSRQQNLTARSTTSSTASHTNASHITDKTDLEIIVNNPDYTPPKQSARPGTTRHKLLQDLRHTEISHIVGGDAVSERNRRNAELEIARKKDYQHELMQQIEEKRRSIELLREKERRQEEVLTRRLQEQLKTIQLEEQLEKEKIRADKLHFDSEQNRLLREQLLNKLEQDAALLHVKDAKEAKAKTTFFSTKDALAANSNISNNNKVYKYFSNSARHEYRRAQPLSTEVEYDLEIPKLPLTPTTLHSRERECFHISEKVCPNCDAPLRSFESSCLRCQRKLNMKLKVRQQEPEATGTDTKNTDKVLEEDTQTQKSNEEEGETGTHATNAVFKGGVDATPMAAEVNCGTFSLVCVNCERLYTLCPTCLAKSDVCRACHRQRNVCMSCRRTLCSFCLDEVACGRDAEHSHINEPLEAGRQMKLDTGRQLEKDTSKSVQQQKPAFQVLQLNYAGTEDKTTSEEYDEESSSPARNHNINKNNNTNSINYTHIQNNLRGSNTNNSSNNNYSSNNYGSSRPPYSMHVERNSIFHPNYQANKSENAFVPLFLPKLVDKQLSFDIDSSATDEHQSIERVRRETDKRLTRYLKNYGDLTGRRSKSESHHRSTQTTPESAARRDIVMHEEHNLSMPLLREMPKMTRSESRRQAQQQQQHEVQKQSSQIEQLSRKWEVPAVQKVSISPTTPKVLTQVGAIRKQLQASSMLTDELEVDGY